MRLEFLLQPRPETISTLGAKGVTLRVGLARVTHNRDGLKIVPQIYPTIELGGESMDIPASWARELAQRVIEMCDEADKLNRNA